MTLDLLLNWGCSAITRDIRAYKVLNKPDAVALAANKLAFFQHMGGIKVPEYATTKREAIRLLEKGAVVCRTLLNSHSGNGIIIARTEDEIVDAPLYTLYVKKKQEYRLHVMRGEVFFVQRKARNRQIPDEEVNWAIRNHSNGFIFAHKDVEVPEEAQNLAVRAVEALGLDFGAVDMLEGVDGEYYVLEVNTAPGLGGLTVEKYKEAFLKYM